MGGSVGVGCGRSRALGTTPRETVLMSKRAREQDSLALSLSRARAPLVCLARSQWYPSFDTLRRRESVHKRASRGANLRTAFAKDVSLASNKFITRRTHTHEIHTHHRIPRRHPGTTNLASRIKLQCPKEEEEEDAVYGEPPSPGTTNLASRMAVAVQGGCCVSKRPPESREGGSPLKGVLLILCFLILFVPTAVFLGAAELDLHVVLPVGVTGLDRVLFELLLH